MIVDITCVFKQKCCILCCELLADLMTLMYVFLYLLLFILVFIKHYLCLYFAFVAKFLMMRHVINITSVTFNKIVCIVLESKV